MKQPMLVVLVSVLAGYISAAVYTAWSAPARQAERYSATHREDATSHEHTLELRRLLEPVMARVGAGRSTCASCGWPWTVAIPHDVDYSPGRSMFAVCEACWQDLSRLGRHEELIGYYQSLAMSWGDDAPSSETVRQAVALDLARTP